PALDADKHYFVGDDEVEKLLAKGESWLASHPERDFIVAGFLKRRRRLMEDALERLRGTEESEPEESDDDRQREEEAVERKISLSEQRMATVLAEVARAGAKSVLDLGCGEGNLLRALLKQRELSRIVGVDVAPHVLARAKRRLQLEQLP